MEQGKRDITTELQKRADIDDLDQMLMVNPVTKQPMYHEFSTLWRGVIRRNHLDSIDELAVFVRGGVNYVIVTDKVRGGRFKWFDEGLGYVPNGGTVFAALDGGYWVRLFNGPRDPRWFGALGNGLANDGPAFQAAINSLQTVGGTLFIPITEDFYWLDQTILSLYSNISIIGDGAKIKSKAGWGPIRAIQKQNIVIEGLRFDGSFLDGNLPETNSTNIFIGFENSDYLRIRDCTFENMTNSAIHSSGSHHGLVENCRFENIRRDISGLIPIAIRPEINDNPLRGSENWIVRGCTFKNPDKSPSSQGAITANGNDDGTSPAKNILIEGCYFEKMGRHQDLDGVPVISGPRGDIDVYNDVYNMIIKNCISVDSMYTFVKGNDGQGIKVIDNLVYNCGERFFNWGQRYGHTQNKDIEVSGNVQIGGAGIKISHSDVFGTRFTIKDNKLLFNSANNTAWGIRLQNIDSFADVSGNYCMGSGIEVSVRNSESRGANVTCKKNVVDLKTIDGVTIEENGIECFNLTGSTPYPMFKLEGNFVRNIASGYNALFFGATASAIIDGTTYENIIGTKIGTHTTTGALYVNGIQEVETDVPDLSIMPSGMKAINITNGNQFVKLQDGSIIFIDAHKPEKLLSSNTFTTNVSEVEISIPSGYNRYKLIIENLRLEGNYSLLMQVSEDDGFTYLAVNYEGTLLRTSTLFDNNTISALNEKASSQFRLSTYNRNANTMLNQYEIILDPRTFFKIRAEAISFDSNDELFRESLTGFVATAAVVNKIRFYSSINNLRFEASECVMKLYGLS